MSLGGAVCRDLNDDKFIANGITNTPMDFADATWWCWRKLWGQTRILTLDEPGFRTYRWGRWRRNRAFTLVLQDA